MVKVKGFHAKRINVKELHTQNDSQCRMVLAVMQENSWFICLFCSSNIFFLFRSAYESIYLYILIWLQVVLFDYNFWKIVFEEFVKWNRLAIEQLTLGLCHQNARPTIQIKRKEVTEFTEYIFHFDYCHTQRTMRRTHAAQKIKQFRCGQFVERV